MKILTKIMVHKINKNWLVFTKIEKNHSHHVTAGDCLIFVYRLVFSQPINQTVGLSFCEPWPGHYEKP
jgi:hypothetical protein